MRNKFLTLHALLLRYGAALLSVGVGIAARHALTPVVGESAAPFATIVAAVMFSAWFAGTGPAALATIAGLVASNWYFLGPTYLRARGVYVVHIATYFFVSGSVLLMSAAYRRSLAKYESELRRREEVEHDLIREDNVLRETEEKFRAVAETAGSAIFIHDGSRLLYVNHAIVELTGYTRDELLAGHLWEMFHPDYRQLLKERGAARFRGEGPPSRYEYKIITKAGEERWLDNSAKLITFEGKPCILAVAFDVTDRKRAEEALRNREEHYRAAIEAGKIGTWEWEIAQDRIIFSDKIYELTGIDKSALYVKFEQWMEQIFKEDRSGVESAIKSALEHDAGYEVEFRVVEQATNEVRWVALSGRVLRDNAGNPLRMLGAAVDITERRRSEEALRNSEKLAATGRLAASIAHEINNPLEAVTNLIFLTRTAGGVNAEGENFLAIAEEELKRAVHITKQTLGFYRDNTFPTRFDVAQAVDDVLSLYARRIEAKGVHVRREYSGSTQMVGIPGEIRQVVSNLLANAVDALPSKPGMLRLRIRGIANWKGRGKAVRITIADNGIGIPREFRKHIFEPFFTTKQHTGTGLGLWLTKSIVGKHQGTIRFASSNVRKTGTVFVLTLPEEQREPALESLIA
jgi:PAS domain S-box-containing protein